MRAPIVKTRLRGKSWDDGWLTAFWGRESRHEKKSDLIFGSPCGPDRGLLHSTLCSFDVGYGKSLVKELDSRGYDITTLQFSVKRKYKPNERPL